MAFSILSPREEEIIRLIIQGKTDRQIASYLGISPRTVSVYVSRIFRKLGVHSRCSAVAVYLLFFYASVEKTDRCTGRCTGKYLLDEF